MLLTLIMTITAPFGTWESSISSDDVTKKGSRPGDLVKTDNAIYWVDPRPEEKGRVALMREMNGHIDEITDESQSSRTRIHEYGGGSIATRNNLVVFANDTDKSLWKVDGERKEQLCFIENGRVGDGIITPDGKYMYGVFELHEKSGILNALIRIDLNKKDSWEVVCKGHDFFAFPHISPDGKKLCWITWDRPNMPWDGTELWIADVHSDGRLGKPEFVAGGVEESIYQPTFSPKNELYFISDKSGFWNIYRMRDGMREALHPMEADFGQPMWVLGGSRFAFYGDKIAAIYTVKGIDKLCLIEPERKTFENVELPFTVFSNIVANRDGLSFFAAAPDKSYTLYRWDGKRLKELYGKQEKEIVAGDISEPEAIAFPTEGGDTAYAFYYPPKNHKYVGDSKELPPLVVMVHGGPTAHDNTRLSMDKLFFTTRGFAVVTVNHRGSTGYGRLYRDKLRKNWGVHDIDDAVYAAKYLVKKGKADPDRLAIRGGSAGGYTTLAALAFRDTFKVGASYFGICDIELLVDDTHKFESRYFDLIVGTYPETKKIYEERSPIHFVDRFNCPVIFFQGTEDKIVPPEQSELMVKALEKKGLAVEYHLYEGEGHGFRKAENIKGSLDSELAFYKRVFNL